MRFRESHKERDMRQQMDGDRDGAEELEKRDCVHVRGRTKRDRPGEKQGLMKSAVYKQHQIPISVYPSLLAIFPSLLLSHRWL